MFQQIKNIDKFMTHQSPMNATVTNMGMTGSMAGINNPIVGGAFNLPSLNVNKTR